MNKLYFRQGISHTEIDGVIRIANDNNIREIIIFADSEWEMNVPTRVLDKLKNNNITLKIVYGSCWCDYYDELANKLGLDINNFYFWDKSLLFKTACSFLLWGDFVPPLDDSGNFKYPFVSLNNRRHIHRCAVIDNLAKHQLIDKGIVTWTNHLNENSDYQFKHFDQRQLLLDDDFIVHMGSMTVPRQYIESFFDLVTESTDAVPFLTEKVAKPILYKKPFAVIGRQHLTKELVRMGFKLYDEIIDYSYDEYPDVNERAAKFVEVLLPIVKRTDWKVLYETLRPKIEYNYNLINDSNFYKDIPAIIIDRYNEIIKENRLNPLPEDFKSTFHTVDALYVNHYNTPRFGDHLRQTN